ncbi:MULTISPECIES: polysaccharide biosynthesis tyrosine autokinase [unclassified Pseudomonas]|uniref:polysaccharide biosynthesis tyrosine autokinase n=1 Tax=unclassified Pseudomonas TaxID=196821 RepID=UPI000731026F|nr:MULTISPECIES: polysaccharide biosynthesis tyrosine autokinase [unclassified Pseudomonas]KSW23380.1 tyrosine protein kinase [Pseudomonas sp. ADP]OBP11911.1 tyrosine-protein kinase [Pseudomonas sp. EGD-AKN5]QOF86323.1 polysaccharide biosynthesis tyrosine autokinase [Pseudomonas sp. ADPe]
MQQQPAVAIHDKDDDEIDLLGLLGTLIDHKWLIAGITAGFMAVGVAYALLATPIYRSDAIVQVEPKKPSIPGLSDMGDLLGAQSEAITEIQLLTSRSVIGKAVDNLKLNIVVEPSRFPLIGGFLARHFRPETPDEVAAPVFGLSRFGWGGEELKVFQLDVPTALLEKNLTLIAGENGSYTLLDDDDNVLVEGKVGEAYDQHGVKIQVESLHANPGTHFDVVRERRLTTILRYQDNLNVAETGKESGIISLSLENDEPARALQVLDEISKLYVRQNVERASAEAASSLEFLRGQLPDVRRELEKAEDALSAYQTKSKSADISLETKALLDQIVALDTNISELKLQQAEMDRKFTRQHPAYQALQTQIGELTSKQNGLTHKVEGLPETQQELLRLTRDVEVSTAIYTQLLNKAQELDVMRAGAVGNVRIIDSADVDITKPVKPKKAMIVLVATLLGLFFAVGLVLLRKALNRGIETPDAIEQLGLPVYASIPYSVLQKAEEDKRDKGRGRSAKAAPLLAISHPTDLAIESLRSLRTSLHFAMLEAGNNRLMISGPSPAVGKTFVSSNLAAVIAQTGQRVLLVDVDMRKGYLHKVLNSGEENGLSDILVKRCDFNTAVRATEIEGFHFIPRGQIPPNPSELLMHPNFTAFLEEASRQFDLIILDTPPLLAVTDAAIVGRQSGTNLIVTRFGLNPAREIELTIRRFAQNGIELKGAIFNGVEKRASAYYGYGGYGYYHYEYKSDKA